MPGWMNIPALADEQPEKRIHMERYEYAARVLTGKRVLDCACGMGYGTDIMQHSACVVMGIDIDPEAIELACELYGPYFQLGDIYDIPISGYDALVCLETLEHLERPEDIITSLPESCREIIASTPIRPTVGWNSWHRSDFTKESLRAMIASRFTIAHEMPQLWVDGADLYLMVHGKR